MQDAIKDFKQNISEWQKTTSVEWKDSRVSEKWDRGDSEYRNKELRRWLFDLLPFALLPGRGKEKINFLQMVSMELGSTIQFLSLSLSRPEIQEVVELSIQGWVES